MGSEMCIRDRGNSTATTIAGAGTSVLVAGAWVVQKSNIGSATTGGRITYTGSTTQEVRIDASLSVKAASASGQNASLYVAKNGTVITASRVNTEVDATVEKNLSFYRLAAEFGTLLNLFELRT